MSLTIGVLNESVEVEHRVALVPDGVQRLRAAGFDVIVERGAGAESWYPDEQMPLLVPKSRPARSSSTDPT